MTPKLNAMIAVVAVLYGAEALADNTSPSMLSDHERATLETLMPADFNKFQLHDEPRPFRDKTFVNEKGEEIDLSAFDGGVTMVNFWATWCPPCLKELPGMDKLQAEMAEDGLNVVAISLDRGGLKKARTFWKRADMKMGLYADPDKDLAQQMGVIGLPVTAILGPDGREIGRLIGEAEWDSEGAQKMLHFLIEATKPNDPDRKEASAPALNRAG
jgi:thiol-disulfide isomerase/thioredoxin